MDRRESFLAILVRLEQWLASEDIPYAVFGSVATTAWIDQGASLDFDRPGARDPARRVPDVDLLVPRACVPRVKAYAEAAMCGEFPVAIDTFWAECWIDFRPGLGFSCLTHRNVRIPVLTGLFTPSRALLFGQPISVLDPRVLLYMYGMVGVARRKDAPRISALTVALAAGSLNSRFTDQECQAFVTFLVARRRRHPLFFAAKRLWVALLDVLPPGVSQLLTRHVQLPANEVFRLLNHRQGRLSRQCQEQAGAQPEVI
jgi:hypothetical protein